MAGFCLGSGRDPDRAIRWPSIPQAEINAKAVRRHYELLQIGGGADGKSRKTA